MPDNVESLLSSKDIQKWFGVSENTVYNWRTKEGMPFMKLTKKTIKYDKEAVKKWAIEKGKLNKEG